MNKNKTNMKQIENKMNAAMKIKLLFSVLEVQSRAQVLRCVF